MLLWIAFSRNGQNGHHAIGGVIREPGSGPGASNRKKNTVESHANIKKRLRSALYDHAKVMEEGLN